VLTDAKRRWRATVLADANLECALRHASSTGSAAARDERVQGSIHKVGAALQGAPSCNGWTFWHVDGAELVALDALRQTYQMQAGLE